MGTLNPDKRVFPHFAGAVMLDKITIEELLRLREQQDAEDFSALTCRPLHPRTTEEKREIYHAALSDPSKLLCKLCLPNEVHPIGKLTATDYNSRNRSAELGYFLTPAYRGKGYMAAAVHAFCGLLLMNLGLNKVYAQTGSFNTASVTLLERVGFHRDGVLRQHHEHGGILWDDYLYSLLAEDYKIKKRQE